MAKRDIEVLKKMIDVYTGNIESRMNSFSFKRGDEGDVKRVAELVANRRLIASFVENDGEVNFNAITDHVFFDSMLYAACAGEEIK